MDELENNGDREELLRLLRELGLKGIPVFVTSREEQDITKVFREAPSISLKDVKNQVEVDMKVYINDEFQKRSKLARLQDGLKSKMTTALVEKADGM